MKAFLKITLFSVALSVASGLFASGAWAGIEALDFDNDQQEAAYRQLVAELRCLVCQNQNLADSNADLAKDLREQVYKRLKAGENAEQITHFMVERYGDFVLYRPPFNWRTAALWAGPPILLIIGLGIAFVFVRSRRKARLDEQGLQRARALLDDEA